LKARGRLEFQQRGVSDPIQPGILAMMFFTVKQRGVGKKRESKKETKRLHYRTKTTDPASLGGEKKRY